MSLDMTSQEKLASMNETVKTLNNTVESQEETISRMDNSSARLHTQIQAISHRISALERQGRQGTHFDFVDIHFFFFYRMMIKPKDAAEVKQINLI